MVLTTPYTRDILGIDDRFVPDSSDFYSPYSLFTLKTQLLPLIHKMTGNPSIDIILPSIIMDDVMRIVVVLKDNDLVFALSPEDELTVQRRIDEITSDITQVCLVYVTYDKYEIDLLSLVDIDAMYDPIINNGYVYINLVDFIGYPEIYNLLNYNIIRQLVILKEQRVIFNAKSIADKFDLESIGNNAYRPNWIESRIHNPYFLQRQLEGDRRIKIRIPPSAPMELVRHYISQELDIKEFTVDDYLMVEVDSIDMLQRILDDVELIAATVTGSVVIERVTDDYPYTYRIGTDYIISRAI